MLPASRTRDRFGASHATHDHLDTEGPEGRRHIFAGCEVGSTVYVSGQIPLDPATGELVTGAMDAQIRRVFDNLGRSSRPAATFAMSSSSTYS